jgi:hypothetical protein
VRGVIAQDDLLAQRLDAVGALGLDVDLAAVGQRCTKSCIFEARRPEQARLGA